MELKMPNFPETLIALREHNFEWLEATFGGAQNAFEAGQLSEEDLSDTFSVFTSNFKSVGDGCLAWLEAKPRSYAAHLAYGLWLSEKGFTARGEASADEVSAQSWQLLSHYSKAAGSVLSQSLELTLVPLVSLVQLGRIEMVAGFTEELEEGELPTWLRLALKHYPKSRSARVNHLFSLQPQWGGSEEEMLAFIRHPDQAAHHDHLMACYHRWMSRYHAAYSEDESLGRRHLELAEALEPDDPSLPYWRAMLTWIEDPKNHDQIIAHFREAISRNPMDLRSHRELIGFLAHKTGVEEEGLRLIEHCIEHGSLSVMLTRTLAWRDGSFGLKPDPRKALQYALAGYAEGCLDCGNIAARILYFGGETTIHNSVIVPELIDKPRALQLALETARAGQLQSCLWVYNLAEKGEFPQLSALERFNLLLSSSQGGADTSTQKIARLIEDGAFHYDPDSESWQEGPAPTEAQRDYQSFEWYLAAAKMGNQSGMLVVAKVLETGNQAVEADREHAMYWYQEAIESCERELESYPNDYWTHGFLAQLLAFEVPRSLRDYPKAVEHYRSACELAPDPDDQARYLFDLALIHEDSLDDREAALKYYKQAAELGHESAKKNLEQLEKRQSGGWLGRLFGRR